MVVCVFSLQVEVKWRFLLCCDEFKIYSICLNVDYTGCEMYMYIKRRPINSSKS